MTTATMTPEQIEAFERLKTQGVPLTTENLADEPVQSVQPQSLYASMEMMLAGQPPASTPYTAQGHVDAAPNPSWLIDGILPDPGLTLVHAGPKRGKTTMAISWLKALEEGTAWAGRETKVTRALYFTEENGSTLGEAFEEIGLNMESGFHLFYPTEIAGHDWKWVRVLVEAVKTAKLYKCDLIFIDTFGVWSSIEDSNNYDNATQTMKIARAASHQSGLPIVILHHDRKGEGSDIESALGSTAIVGGPDHIIRLKGVEGNDDARHLAFNSRFRGAKEITVKMTDGQYVESTKPSPYQEIIDLAFKGLKMEDFLSRKQIRANAEEAGMKCTEDTSKKLVRAMVSKGILEKEFTESNPQNQRYRRGNVSLS